MHLLFRISRSSWAWPIGKLGSVIMLFSCEHDSWNPNISPLSCLTLYMTRTVSLQRPSCGLFWGLPLRYWQLLLRHSFILKHSLKMKGSYLCRESSGLWWWTVSFIFIALAHKAVEGDNGRLELAGRLVRGRGTLWYTWQWFCQRLYKK